MEKGKTRPMDITPFGDSSISRYVNSIPSRIATTCINMVMRPFAARVARTSFPGSIYSELRGNYAIVEGERSN